MVSSVYAQKTTFLLSCPLHMPLKTRPFGMVFLHNILLPALSFITTCQLIEQLLALKTISIYLLHVFQEKLRKFRGSTVAELVP